MNRDRPRQEAGQKMVRSFPRRRHMTTTDLEGLMLSDQARAITGGVFTVDDGRVCRDKFAHDCARRHLVRAKSVAAAGSPKQLTSLDLLPRLRP
jgi:hypothetical protein